MVRAISQRIVHLVPVLFLVSLATFLMLQLVPGDPAVAIVGPNGTPEQYARARADLGLDKPLVQQYFSWMGDTLRGDLGRSVVPPVQDVADMIKARLPITLELAFVAIVLSLVISIPVALLAAYRAGKRFDRVASGVAFACISIPSFLGALILMYLLVFHPDIPRWVCCVGLGVLAVWLATSAVQTAQTRDPTRGVRPVALRLVGAAVVGFVAVALFTNWPSFPRQGFVRLTSDDGVRENLRSVFVPALTLAIIEAAVLMRVLRGDLIATMREDFILASKAKGMPPARILLGDALRPSSFSVITVAGVALGRLIGGAVVVEAVFNLPGMGTMIVDGVSAKDYRVVQAGVLVVAVFYVMVNTVVDISYAYLDPRIRRGRR